eukprot:jgi/Psemu1/39780/gm1.39780_g
MENTAPQSAYKRKALKPRYLLDSAEYCARMTELNDGDENNERNPFLYHFETGFDALCAKNGNLVLTILNGCNKIDDVRDRLDSPKGHFNEEEALEIWEQCLKYVTEDMFPFYKEGDTDAVDHVWALGIIVAHILCGYPALKGTEDIQCYNNVGIGRPVQSGERERLELNEIVRKAVTRHDHAFLVYASSDEPKNTSKEIMMVLAVTQNVVKIAMAAVTKCGCNGATNECGDARCSGGSPGVGGRRRREGASHETPSPAAMTDKLGAALLPAEYVTTRSRSSGSPVQNPGRNTERRSTLFHSSLPDRLPKTPSSCDERGRDAPLGM